ncbi:MAG TPA: porin [Vicinamibacterales bacterium]|nr:porin [Vicinamibacterales bacterium]
MLTASLALLLALADSPVPVTDPPPSATAAAAAAPAPGPAPLAEPVVVAVPPAAAVSGAVQDTGQEAQGLRFVWRDHPSVRAGDWLRLDFGAKIQGDKMNPGDDPADFDDLILRRARIGVDGELFRVFQFSVERELTDISTASFFNESSKTQWRDVWGEVKFADALQVRGGRFKIPFSRDQLDGEASNDFVNRSLGGEYLAPGRDTGGMVHGRFFDRALGYDVGLFEHDGDNSQANKIAGGDRTFAARLTAMPFFAVKTGNLDQAEVGLNFASTDVSDSSTLPNGLRGRTAVSQYTFFQPVFVQGTRRRWGADFDWTRRQVGLRTEFIVVTDQRTKQGLRGDTLNDAVYHAWYVSGAWVLTGERSDRAIRPRRPLFMGGFGAVQVAARFERLWFDSKDTGEPAFSNSRAEVILPNGDKVLTLGVNWYLNRWMKLQLNAVHDEIEDTGRTPLLDGGTKFWSTVIRAQLVL